MRDFLRSVIPAPLKRCWHLVRGLPRRWRVALTKDTSDGEFRVARPYLPQKIGLIVDVGANDGISGSQSFPYIARGYRAILIEPHPRAFAQLQQLHQGNERVTLLNIACSERRATLPLFEGVGGSTGTSTLSRDSNEWLDQARSDTAIPVEVYTLKEVLEERDVPSEFDVLSIDTEHMDYEVLLGLDLSIFRPTIIITEESGFHKDALKHQLLSSHNYDLIARIECNTIWKRTG